MTSSRFFSHRERPHWVLSWSVNSCQTRNDYKPVGKSNIYDGTVNRTRCTRVRSDCCRFDYYCRGLVPYLSHLHDSIVQLSNNSAVSVSRQTAVTDSTS